MGSRILLKLALLYAAAIASGYLSALAHVPLPWMIGPMVLATMVSLSGADVRVPISTRLIGQVVVASSVGLFFTPSALAVVSEQIVPMVAASILTIAVSLMAAILLSRLAHVDALTSYLASIPSGPAEMATLAAQHGLQPGPVAFAQILRMALLVLIIPLVLTAINGSGNDVSVALSSGTRPDPAGSLLLLALALVAAFILYGARITSPFFLGPLAAGAIASAMLLPVSAFPYSVIAGAQVLLGVSVGSMFDRDLVLRVRSLFPAILASTLFLLVCCTMAAFAFSAMSGITWPTMILANAPGGATEMALTAKVLQHDVAIVTAFHVFRIFIIIPVAPVMLFILARFVRNSSAKPRPVSDERD